MARLELRDGGDVVAAVVVLSRRDVDVLHECLAGCGPRTLLTNDVRVNGKRPRSGIVIVKADEAAAQSPRGRTTLEYDCDIDFVDPARDPGGAIEIAGGAVRIVFPDDGGTPSTSTRAVSRRPDGAV